MVKNDAEKSPNLARSEELEQNLYMDRAIQGSTLF